MGHDGWRYEFHGWSGREVRTVLQIVDDLSFELVFLLCDCFSQCSILFVCFEKLLLLLCIHWCSGLWILAFGDLRSAASWPQRTQQTIFIFRVFFFLNVHIVLEFGPAFLACLLQVLLQRCLLVDDFVIDVIHAVNASWRHERIMVSSCQVVQSLCFELGYLVAPSEENGLISRLTSSIVGGGHLKDCFIGESAWEPADLTHRSVCVFDHRDLNSLPFSLDHSHDEVHLLGAHLPVLSKTLLDVSYPETCFNDLGFQV